MLARDMNKDLYRDIVETLAEIAGNHRGYRPVHAKGIICSGVFTASPEAARFSRAAHLQGQPVAAIIRFSNASGDPNVHDGERNGRGMAVAFKLLGQGTTDIVAQSTKGFPAGTPEEFLDFLRALLADARSASEEHVKAFLTEHPHAKGFIERLSSELVPASYTTIPYYAVNAFRFINASGESRIGRYRFVPEVEAYLSSQDAEKQDRDFLEKELATCLPDRPAVFKLVVQVAGPDDITDNPTVLWPEDRQVIELGRLEIKAVSSADEADQNNIVFDPGRLVDGIELSNDPVLGARPDIYAISFARRSGRS